MRMLDIRSLLVIAVVGAFSSTLLGCPDKAAPANPDPATGKDSGTTPAAKAAAPAGSTAAPAAPAKSGGW